MEADLAAAVPDSDDAAVRATREVLAGLDVQKQAGPGSDDGTDVDALDTEQQIRARAPAPSRTRHGVIHVRVSLRIGLLDRYQFKEALASFPPHHAAAPHKLQPQTALPCSSPTSRQR